ncbi:MAG: carboxypeptidase-like regulatory domain-containing protein [Deltaproteobacteria bacterium]|nr:carboxypeptidase-like regulatory domain-containing protein [Deltaproteobacteria bacterium]
MRLFLALVVAASGTALLPTGGCVGATNPFDPEAPAELQAPARVGGTVVDALGPVGGAQVFLGDKVQDTRDDGTFAFDSVPPGVVRLSVDHPAHAPLARDLVLAPGEERTEDVTLLSTGVDGSRVHGIARMAAEVGDADADMSGIVVEVVDVVGARTQTNKDGNYDLALANGTYTLSFSASEHLSQTIPNVVVDGDTEVEVITLPVNPGSVEGLVTLEPLIPGTPAHGGVLVTIGNKTAITGDDDRYSITGLGAGAALAVFTRDDYATVEKPIVVDAGALITIDPVRMARASGGVSGTVDVNGVSDDSATVTLSGSAGTFATASAPTGAFTFQSVPSGTYNLAAARTGFVAGEGGAVEVLPGAVSVVDDVIVLNALIGDFAINGGAAFTNDRVLELVIQSDDAVDMRLSERADLADATPQTFDPSPQFTLTSVGDGEKTVFLELIDENGDPTGPFSASIVLDTTPPANASIAAPAFSNDAAGIVPLGLFATDDLGSGVAEMQVDVDGTFSAPFQAFATALALPIVPNSEGPHTLSARFRDRAGNETATLGAPSVTVTLDRLVPVVDAVTIRDATTDRTDFATNSQVIVDITRALGSDDATLMAVSVDPLFPVEVFEPFSALRVFTLLPGQGSREVAVKLKDAAGNVSNARADAIVVDSVGPRGAFVRLAGGADVTNDETPGLALFADDFTEVRVSTDGVFDAAAEQYAAIAPTTISIADGGDGDKTVFAQFKDGAGNESDVVSDSVELDSSDPVLDADPSLVGDEIVVAFDGTAAGAAFTDSVSVVVSFDVDGADEMALSTDGVVDSEAFQPFASVTSVLLPAGDCLAADDACKQVCALFRDRAGNTTAEVCDAIGLDTTPPSAPLFIESDGVVAANEQTLHLVDKVEDAFFDHYEIFVSPSSPAFSVAVVGAASGGARPVDVVLTGPPPGTPPQSAAASNLIRMVAVDSAGNVSPESTITLVVDDVAPAAPTLAGLPAVLNADTVSVNFLIENPADDDATFDHYLIDTSLLPAPIVSFQRDGIVVTLLPDQVNTIVVQAVDAAGNISLPSATGADVGTVREDSTVPSAPVIAPFGGIVRADNVELYVIQPSIDRFDVDGAGPLGSTIVSIASYDVKDGQGLGFQRQAAGIGPFVAVLKRDLSNEVCVRGIDAAGNESDTDCIIIDEESSRTAVGVQDGPKNHDIFGDFMVFVGDDNRPVLRDLTGTAVDRELTGFGNPTGGLSIVGDNNALRVVYDVAGGSFGEVQLDVASTSRPFGPGNSPQSFPGFASSVGTASAFGASFEIVYAVPGVVPDTVDLRRRPAVLLIPQVEDADITPTDIVLCAGTTPVVSSGVVVWCEDLGATSVVRRQRASGGAIDTVSRPGRSVPLERPSFFGDPTPQFFQPVVTDAMIAWAEDVGGVPRLVFLDDPLQSPPVPVVIDTIDGVNFEIDSIADASDALLALDQLAVGGLSNDVFVLDVLRRVLVQITNDLPPQKNIRVDGSRVAFEDSATGSTVVVSDLSRQRWLAGSTELAFDALTSTSGAVWAETRNNVVRLVGRAPNVVGAPVVEIDELPALQVVFNGPAREDPAWAIGGTVVAWLSGGPSAPFTLTVKEINSGAKATVSTLSAGVIALDPDGDQIVFVDVANDIQRVPITFSVGPPATLVLGAAVLVEGVNPATDVLFVDVDDDQIVWQEGGLSGDDRTAGELRCEPVAGGASLLVPLGGSTPRLGRGPKLGRRASTRLLAYAEGGISGRVCPFTCTVGAATCTPRLEIGGPQVGSTQHTRIAVSRDGVVAYLSNELNGSKDVVVFDPFSARRSFLTFDTADQDGVAISDGHVTYADPTLGNFDEWEVLY